MFALEAQGIRKSYGGVQALSDVSLGLRPGAVHALLGENGAGKSTLVKIMTGVETHDRGSLRLNGNDVSFASTAEAIRHGVAMVSQELSLFPHLSLLANMFPMREPRRGPFVSRKRMAVLATPILRELGVTAALNSQIQALSLADRQLVEIAKALVAQPRVLLLDEPTSALDESATARLLGILRVLRDRDVAVVYVSHILEEVMSVCDEVTVLRDGQVVVAGEPIADHTIPSLVKAMIGDKKVVESGAAQAAALQLTGEADSGLRVDSVCLLDSDATVSFAAQPGEVVGLVGLVGSGPTSMLRTIAGIDRLRTGTITLPGRVPVHRNQRRNIRAGMAYVSGDRRRYGLILDKPIWENIVQVRTMGLARDGHFLRRRALVDRAAAHIRGLQIKVSSPLANVNSLSGGNQQKVVLAKWLDNAPSTILLDDPTRGVDIGARAEIHALLRGSARAGAVVLVCSTDLEELAAACDRVLVFYRGSICAQLQGEQITSQNMLELMNTGKAQESIGRPPTSEAKSRT
jgi:ABC-type sugar transport system ATPase subunit